MIINHESHLERWWLFHHWSPSLVVKVESWAEVWCRAFGMWPALQHWSDELSHCVFALQSVNWFIPLTCFQLNTVVCSGLKLLYWFHKCLFREPTWEQIERKQNSLTKWIERQGVCSTDKINLELPNFCLFCFVLFFQVAVGLPWTLQVFKRSHTWCVGTSAQFSSSRRLFATAELVRVALSWGGKERILSGARRAGRLLTCLQRVRAPLLFQQPVVVPSRCVVTISRMRQDLGSRLFCPLVPVSRGSPADSGSCWAAWSEAGGAKAESGSKGELGDPFWMPDFPLACLACLVE